MQQGIFAYLARPAALAANLAQVQYLIIAVDILVFKRKGPR